MKTPSRTPRRLFGVMTALAALGVATLAAATSASAATTPSKVTFGVQPATAGKPDARPNLSYGVTPGSTVRDQVAIVNFSAEPLTLSVYATDAINTSAGGFGLLDGAHKPQDVGIWTSIDNAPPATAISVTVPARRSSGPGYVVLPELIKVPAGTSPGDHVGGVVAVLSTIGTNKQGAKVRLDQRVGTRMFVRVSGTAVPRLSVDHVTTTYHSGGATLGSGSVTVSYTVHNLGNVTLGAHQFVAVAGRFGLGRASASPADLPLLLPGGSARETATVHGVLPLFHLGAKITLSPIHPPGFVDPALPAQVATQASFWAVPWGLFVIIPLLLVGIALLVRHRRTVSWKRRHRRRTPSVKTTTLTDLIGTRIERQKVSS